MIIEDSHPGLPEEQSLPPPGRVQIGGFQECSLTDFPGHIAAVIYTQGCPWRCPYCHNPGLVDPARFGRPLEVPHVLSALRSEQGFIDGVVVTGGEPSLHPGLGALLGEIRALGLATKLDTSGALPGRLAVLLGAGLVDYVALDIKTGPLGYAALTGDARAADNLGQSLDLLRRGSVPYELRTTVYPDLLQDEDLRGGWRALVAGAPRLALQPFIPRRDLFCPGASAWPAVSAEALGELASEVAPLVGEVLVRA